MAGFSSIRPSAISEFSTRPKPIPAWKGTEAYKRKMAWQISEPKASSSTDPIVDTTGDVIDLCSDDELDSFRHLDSSVKSAPPIAVLEPSSDSNKKKKKRKRADALSTNAEIDALDGQPSKPKKSKGKAKDAGDGNKAKKTRPGKEPAVFKSSEFVNDSDGDEEQQGAQVRPRLSYCFILGLMNAN